MEHNEALFETAIFGKVVENFLSSELGDYLLGQAKREEDEAMRALVLTSPWRRRRIQQLQNAVWRAQQFQIWLGDAIAAGHQATNLLEGEE